MVSAIRSPNGASRHLLMQALEGDLHPLVSVPLMVEYEAVMTREHHLAHSCLSRLDVEEILDTVMLYAERVRVHFTTRPATKDAADDMVLETAVNGHADALVTENTADFRDGAERYGIRLLKPGAALMTLKGRTI